MRHLRHALAFALTLSAVQLVSTEVSAQKVGVVDLERALNETEDGRQAKDRLKQLFDKRQKTLQQQERDLQAMQEDLSKQKDVLTPEVRTKKAQELQKKIGELQTTYVEFQRELAAKEAELTKPILDRMKQIVRRIGQTDGYSIIMDRSSAGVVYVPSSYDLTDVVIQRYNAGEGKSSSDKPPSAKKPKKK